jgi:type I restriction enzyme M protein
LSDEQIQNLAIIPRLHKGRRAEFVTLVDGYFRNGLERLQASYGTLPALAERLRAVLGEDPEAGAEGAQASAAGLAAVDHLVAQWVNLAPVARAQQHYFASEHDAGNVDARNEAQHALRARYTPFFQVLHDSLKALDKAIRELDKRRAEAAKAAGKRGGGNRQTKAVKEAVQALHDEVKRAESYFGHIEWLQQRFPKAAYEDVTGLCKLATQMEIAERDWSLNPGRYVGVVIEEDGRTEEEFQALIAQMRDEFRDLSEQVRDVERVIFENASALLDER